MTMTLRSCALLALACALAACGSEKNETSVASGNSEVLKGTISDDMIPYDTLRSQPPAARIETDSTGSSGNGSTSTAPYGEATHAATQGESTDENAGAGQASEADADSDTE